jgi:formate dehydrogenase
MEGSSLPDDRANAAVTTHHTFCRLCEGVCGLTVQVAGDRVVDVKPDKLNPLSRGFICIKGKNSHRIIDDPERVLEPQRQINGAWSPAAWDVAIADIAARILKIKETHGSDAIALYIGNPSAMSSSTAFAASAYLRSLGSRQQYSAMSLDNMNKFAVAELMYGDKSYIFQRDWEGAGYMLVLGSNPRVSIFGQLSTRPRGLEEIRAARGQGGRLVVVDPRRTETATLADEHLAIIPGTDTFFLLALLQTIVTEKLYNADFVERYCINFDNLRHAVAEFTPDSVAGTTGLPADTIRRVAREFAGAKGAFALGNTGVTQQRHATVNEWTINALNAITGNVDRAGGVFFNPGIVDEPHPKKVIDYSRPSRIGNYPRILGEYPATTLADEILTQGTGQIRALIVVAGNPLATGSDIARLRKAFESLDLLVSIDLFHSATSKLAHWVLPATSFYERKDLNIQFTRHTPFPFVQHTDRVIPPRGQAREEWEIFRDLHVAIGTPFLNDQRAVKLAKERGSAFDMDTFYKSFLEARGRISLDEIKQHPHGIKLGEKPIGAFREIMERRGLRVDLMPQTVRDLLPGAGAVTSLASAEFPMLLISRRNLRSVCSWYHLDERQDASNFIEMNQLDAEQLGIAPDSTVCVRSATGEITAQVKLTDVVCKGVVCMQYGLDKNVFERKAGTKVTMNYLVSKDSNCDALTGMPTLNGIPVQIIPYQQ